MAYEVYYNKQAPRNITESPNTQLGITAAPNLNEGITARQGIGIGVVAAQVIPAGKQIFNTVIDATGDKRLEKNVKRIGSLITFGITAVAVGLPAAIAIELGKAAVQGVQAEIQETIDQTNQNYERQKVGVAVNKFIGVGERID